MIANLIKQDLKQFKPYAPSPTIEQISKEIGLPVDKIIKIDTAENPFVEKLQNKKVLSKLNLNQYPDPFSKKIKKKLAKYTGFSQEWIMCGNGSDELIDLVIRAIVSPREEIIINPPTFSMYEFYARLSGAKVKKVLRLSNFRLDIQKIRSTISQKTKLIFVDSPGNPTSVVTSRNEIKKLLGKQVAVVVDEAYFEYSGKTALPLVKRYPNLIVLRSFSKWAGLAGVRIGYLVGNPKLVKALTAIKPPYNVNSAAQALACSVLDNSQAFLEELKKLVVYRSILTEKLSQIKAIEVFPSEGAYIIFKPSRNTDGLYHYLRANGVLVKGLDLPRAKKCIRINLTKEKEVQKLTNLIKKFYEKN